MLQRRFSDREILIIKTTLYIYWWNDEIQKLRDKCRKAREKSIIIQQKPKN